MSYLALLRDVIYMIKNNNQRITRCHHDAHMMTQASTHQNNEAREGIHSVFLCLTVLQLEMVLFRKD